MGGRQSLLGGSIGCLWLRCCRLKCLLARAKNRLVVMRVLVLSISSVPLLKQLKTALAVLKQSGRQDLTLVGVMFLVMLRQIG